MNADPRKPWWRVVAWIGLALAGLATTAALAIATSQLTVARVGLAGEPPAAAAHLAPARPREEPPHAPATTTTGSHGGSTPAGATQPPPMPSRAGDGDGDSDDD